VTILKNKNTPFLNILKIGSTSTHVHQMCFPKISTTFLYGVGFGFFVAALTRFSVFVAALPCPNGSFAPAYRCEHGDFCFPRNEDFSCVAALDSVMQAKLELCSDASEAWLACMPHDIHCRWPVFPFVWSCCRNGIHCRLAGLELCQTLRT
jgi:hypothetical protein